MQHHNRIPKRKPLISDEEQGAMGRIMLGKYNDQAVVVIEYMEGEYGDGFVPRFQSILENVEFKS